MHSAHPQLYDISTDGAVILRGMRCRACEYWAFPAQSFGCERCGAHGADLESRRLSGHGTVQSTAVVHRHPASDIAVPFTVAAIVLDEGPLIRGVLTGEPAPLTTAVVPTAVPVGDDTAELRFTPEALR